MIAEQSLVSMECKICGTKAIVVGAPIGWNRGLVDGTKETLCDFCFWKQKRIKRLSGLKT